MATSFIFDTPASRRIIEARQEGMRSVLLEMREKLKLRSVADVGCGVGYFSAFLKDMGFDVTGFDGRPSNLEEAHRRHPAIQFVFADVEEASILQAGAFDLVFCVGLLYHLENPLRALRNLAAITKTILLIESRATPQRESAFYLKQEPMLEDQSLRSLALYPSESSLIQICYKLGFSSVYRTARFPNHEDFRDQLGRKRQRTILVASKHPVESAHLLPLPEPPEFYDPWQTTAGRILSYWRRLIRRRGQGEPPKSALARLIPRLRWRRS